MSRRAGCVVLVLVGLFAGGLFLTWVGRQRATQAREYCVNNLRELARFADQSARPPAPDRPAAVNTSVPPGTVHNPALPPDHRLSWVVDQLPSFNQRRQDTTGLSASLDRTRPWDADPNRTASHTPLGALVCFGNPRPAPPDAPAVTQYVGAGGVGADAPALPFGPGGADPRAGCYRYDGPTPFEAVTDALGSTVLFAEVSADVGPWLRGGPATVRTLDTADGARPPVGPGGQFSGNHLGGGNFAFADGSVRFLSDRTDPRVMYGLFTIAGAGHDPPPGE